MPSIMCTKELWIELGGAGPLRPRLTLVDGAPRLTAWAAKLVSLPEGFFIVVVNEETCLTAVIPFVTLDGFPSALAQAVAAELVVQGVAREQIAVEVASILNHTRYSKNSNRSLLGSLNELCFLFEFELRDLDGVDATSLLEIQHKLNRVPHSKREPVFAHQAVAELFQDASAC